MRRLPAILKRAGSEEQMTWHRGSAKLVRGLQARAVIRMKRIATHMRRYKVQIPDREEGRVDRRY